MAMLPECRKTGKDYLEERLVCGSSEMSQPQEAL